jgi:TonB-dependent SusC/RagA subfamily outer membrane receptor
MKHNFGKFLCGFFLLLTLLSFASGDKLMDFTNQIINRFNKIWISAPQEKVYLQTDKPYYSAGEDIWFKGYLVNATTHSPDVMSRFLYVELADHSDSVVSRVKIRKDSLGFSGNIKLKPELPAGNYTLRAFTYWMQNSTSDFFFNKNIYIGNNIDGVTSQIKFGAAIDGNIPVSLVFTNNSQASQVPVSGKTVLVREIGSRTFRKKYAYKTDAGGKIMFQIAVDSTDHTRKSIEVSINEDALKYSNTFYLPDTGKDFDVRFFPESGVFLSENLQNIAFKAIGADGLSVEVEGKVLTGQNEEVISFTSLNKGMGKFLLEPRKGESYYALVKASNGREKRFNLPVALEDGVALHLARYAGKIVYEVINHTNKPNNSLFMLIHSRGKVIAIYPVKTLNGQIPEPVLPAGINSFAIIDSAGNTLCERLFFQRDKNQPLIGIQSDKAIYGKREPVKLNLNVRTPDGKPCSGNYSISVTDGRTVQQDTLSDNILSYLLLSSDIKGYIEDPASYFTDNSYATLEKLDILMLTQGWRRFRTADAVMGQFAKPAYYLEAGQALSGKVVNILGKPVKKCDVIALSGYKNIVRTTQTDSLGCYLIDGIEFPDSTSFVLKAKKKSTFMDVEIIPDPDKFLNETRYFPVPRTAQTPAPQEYFQQSKEKYYYEGGMRAVNLDEITIVADKKKSGSQSQYYAGLEDAQLTTKELEKFPGTSILMAISRLPGVMVSGNSISIRGSTSNPYILIDGFGTESIDEISYLNTNDVEEISVFKGASASIFGSRGGNGVIAITLKSGIDMNSKKPQPASLAHVIPLGYQKPVEFYEPKYEVDSVRRSVVPDLRTTIYWNPALKSDSTGMVHVQFYTADKANNYSMVLEGITDEGEICRYSSIIRRENN